MHGYDANTVRSRYDYYYSISSPSLSQATNYFDNQASLFGEPIAPLLPPPVQKCHSPQSIPTPLTPFNSHISSTSSARTNFSTTGVHPSLIETFDNHLYESIRKNILDRKNNNQIVTDDLNKHQVWTQFSSSSTDSPQIEEDSSNGNNIDVVGPKRANTSFGFYKNESDRKKLGPRQRTLSAISHTDIRKTRQTSTETNSDIENSTIIIKRPPRIPYTRNKSNLDRTSSSTSSKLNHTVTHVVPVNTKKPPLNSSRKLPLKRPNAVVPYTMVKSKSDLMSLKSYPESFTIVTSPRRSPSAGFKDTKRRKCGGGKNDDDEDSVMDFEWVKPSPAKLLEAAQSVGGDDVDMVEETPYNTDIFGQHVSIPTTPILTDKVMVGSSHRVHAGTVSSHKKQAFAIINDYKNRKTRLLQHRHSEENMIDGRFSPYTRYCLQRELSAPTLNRLESFESDDGEFYYYFEDDPNADEKTGRQTSIGFVHKKSRSASMSNLASSGGGGGKKRPKSEMQKHGPQYASTPNFININKRAVIHSLPMEKINPRLVLHRSLKGVLKVYNNTNVQKRTFSLEDTDIILANGKIDPRYLAAMPIPNDDKRSDKLAKQQAKHGKKRALLIRRRKLSPIAGTPSKEASETTKKTKKKPNDRRDEWTPKRILNTPMRRLEERLKKDKFGRLITPKKAPLPDFKNVGKKVKKKKTGDDDDEDEVHVKNDADEIDERDQKAINFMQQLQARHSLGKALLKRREAKQPPPLTRQASRQSITSNAEKPPLSKKNSKSSLKSVSSSIKTTLSLRSAFGGGGGGKNDRDEEEAEAGDEITKLQDVKGAKKDAKSKVKGSMKILSLGRVASASSTKSQKESAPPPSRTGSKTSILSMAIDGGGDKAQDTPSRKSEILRAPSASSVMSMTTAAITANPLNTTLTITNQLASQGAELREKNQMAGHASGDKLDEMIGMSGGGGTEADRMSMSSQKTVSSQKTNTSKAGSRKTSAKAGKDSAKSSAGYRSRQGSGGFIGAIVSAHHAVKQLARRKSNDSIKSEKSDATQITIGPGHGADNKDSSLIAGKVLEHSQRSLEKVQKTVDKATHEIHQTINEKLSDLKTLEKKLSKSNLLEHDANNNDVEKSTAVKSISRHSTKHDLAGTSTTLKDTSTKSNTNITTQQQAAAATTTSTNLTTGKSDTKSSTMMDKDRLSVNAISVAPDARSVARGGGGLENQQSEDSNQMDTSTSSSMTEMRRKRCWGLSSCCDRKRSDSAQMMISGKSDQPQTKCQKCKNCMCTPFNWMCRPFKRRKMDEMDMKKKKDKKMMSGEKLKWWERICCCSGCCKRCTKKGREERMKKKKMMSMKSTAKDETKPSCWSRLNCFKCCKPFCTKICCCSPCCRKKQEDSMMSLESPKANETPSTCTRIFCFCCLCCRKPATEGSEKRASMTSQQSQQQQQKEGNCCSRFCTTLFCCCCKKQSNRDSRRTSMLSKKQSLAPTIPPPEEKKPKLEMVLVEHASLMKGAIPVLPLCLAYFFLICNIIIPGSGTILSGIICLCIGIPRFSQHDGARGRIGSFIINCIVGVSQAFTVIFCFVGWGWSIWWGTIMIHLAKRHKKLKKAEMLRQLDAERQAAEGDKGKEETRPGISRGKSRDVERGIN